MPDHATSTSPAVQTQLDRLWSLSPGADILGLDRITELLARLGNPHENLPPVFHVAGTNGKGSTCAFLRAAIEAAGYTAHVYTSPHLVRFNERIRIAGTLIEDEMLAALLEEVLDVAGHGADGIGASFFEVTTAVAFLAFSRTPADACIIEVGLGGRLDATNVIARPAVTGIAQLGIDHQSFLGDTLLEIAGEKAGIAKPGIPLVTMDYPKSVREKIARVAAATGAPVLARGTAWTSETARSTMRYADTGFDIVTRRPRLTGTHQSRNLALAIAMLRHHGALNVPEAAYRAAADWAHWPARMQRLGDGPLTARLPAASEIWLDGAHNPAAAKPLAKALRRIARGRPVTLITGMLANKDAPGVLRELAAQITHVIAVPVPGHAHHDPESLADIARSFGLTAATAPSFDAAIATLDGAPRVVLIAGTLYLAGEVLAANDEPPV